jgi:hypothetical protein
MRIIRFNQSRLRNEEWFQFHTDFSGLVSLYGDELLGVKRLYTPYCELYKEADVLLELLRKSFLTPDSTAEDRQRDNAFRSLRDSIKSFLNFPDPVRQKAAGELFAVVEKYGKGILKGTHADETASINNLLQDLTGQEGGIDLSAQMTALGLSAWVTALQEANEAYKNTMNRRYEETSERPDAGRMREVRAATDHHYVTMANIIDGQLLAIGDIVFNGEDPGEGEKGKKAIPATPDEKVVHFAKSLNARIAYYKALLELRTTRNTPPPSPPNTEVLAEA